MSAEKLRRSLEALERVYQTRRIWQMERWECWRLATEERHQRNIDRRRKVRGQDSFSLQNVNWHPPKYKLAPCKLQVGTSNLQFVYRNTQISPLPNLHFGGCQLALWRLKLSWGYFVERGGPPKGGSLGSPKGSL